MLPAYLGSYKGYKMDYSEHYKKAKEKYCHDNKMETPIIQHPSDKIALSINSEKNLVLVDSNYYKMVDSISSQVKLIYDLGKNCEYIPSKEDPLAMQYRNNLDISGVDELADYIIPQLEKSIFYCNLMCDRLLTMRSCKSKRKPSSSWLWHYDNQPKEIVKIMIYLNDIGVNNAPFEYIHGPHDQIEIIPPTKNGPNDWKPDTKWINTRVPKKEIDKRLSSGAYKRKIVGPKGTMVIFDNNIIHKANVCSSGYRDVIFFRIRPTINQKKPYIHHKWTGSYWSGGAPPDPRHIGGDKGSELCE